MKKKIILVTIFIVVFLLSGVFLFIRSQKNITITSAQPLPSATLRVRPTSLIPSFTPTPTLIPVTPSPTRTPPKLIFSVGSQAGPAMNYRLVKEAPVRMLTSWYNGTKDLEWMGVQKNDLIPRLYANKYLVHIITWTDLPEEEIDTPYGRACGRPYPVSTQILDDMKQLAQIYNGPGPLYLTLFTEFQTFTCIDNNWNGNENYYRTLKDNYLKIKDIFHESAPNSQVALSWGGWISRYDDPVNQGGRSLFNHFDEVIRASDFTAFQAMESDTNIQEMLDMTKILGSYGKPVMLAHYKPHSNSQEVFDADVRRLFTDDIITQLTNSGLFAFSFMDYEHIEGSETTYNLIKNGIEKYAR